MARIRQLGVATILGASALCKRATSSQTEPHEAARVARRHGASQPRGHGQRERDGGQTRRSSRAGMRKRVTAARRRPSGARVPRAQRRTLPPTPLEELCSPPAAPICSCCPRTRARRHGAARRRRAIPVCVRGELRASSKRPSRRRVAPSCSSMPICSATRSRARITALDALAQGRHARRGGASVAERLMGLLSERKIHRLLIKPAALGITRLLVESAVNRCLQLARGRGPRRRETRGLPPRARAPARASSACGSGVRAAGRRCSSASRIAWLCRTAALGAAGSGGRAAPLAAPSLAVPRSVGVLAAADTAFREGRLRRRPATTRSITISRFSRPNPPSHGARSSSTRRQHALFAQAEAALLADDHAACGRPRSRRAARRPHQQPARVSRGAARARAQPHAARRAASAGAAAGRDAAGRRRRARRAREPVDDRAGADSARRSCSSLQATAHASTSIALSGSRRTTRTSSRSVPSSPPRSLAARARARAGQSTAPARSRRCAPATAQSRGIRATRRRGRAAARASARTASCRMARAGRARDAQGALVAPADDSARHYSLELQREAPDAARPAAWRRRALRLPKRAARSRGDWTRPTSARRARARRTAPRRAVARAASSTAGSQEHYLAVAVPASELELVERAAPVVSARSVRSAASKAGSTSSSSSIEPGDPAISTVVAAEPEGQFEDGRARRAGASTGTGHSSSDGRLFARRVRLESASSSSDRRCGRRGRPARGPSLALARTHNWLIIVDIFYPGLGGSSGPGYPAIHENIRATHQLVLRARCRARSLMEAMGSPVCRRRFPGALSMAASPSLSIAVSTQLQAAGQRSWHGCAALRLEFTQRGS